MAASRDQRVVLRTDETRRSRSGTQPRESIWRGVPPRLVRDLAAERLRVLAHPVRLQIVERLRGGPVSVGGLAEEMGLSADAVSKHLGALARSRLVTRTQDGNVARYALADEAVVRVAAVIYRDVVRDLRGLAELASDDREADSNAAS